MRTEAGLSGVQRGWHALTVVVVCVSVVGQLVSSVTQGQSAVDVLSYFTIQSNILVLATAVALLAGVSPETGWFRVLRLAGLTGITITFVVFAVLIGPFLTLHGVQWWLNIGLHYAAPLLAVGGLFVGPRAPWQWRDLAFIGWPALWLVWTYVRAAALDPAYVMPDGSTAEVPYVFLDVATVGLGMVAVANVMITLLLVGVASGFVAASRRGLTSACGPRAAAGA